MTKLRVHETTHRDEIATASVSEIDMTSDETTYAHYRSETKGTKIVPPTKKITKDTATQAAEVLK